MNGKMFQLTSDDEIKITDYTGYDSLSHAVNGMIELVAEIELPVRGLDEYGKFKNVNFDIYCNEEFLYMEGDEFNKANALTMAMIDHDLIRGNTVLIPIDTKTGANYGLSEDEADYVHKLLSSYKKEFKNKIKKIHTIKDNDRTCPEPQVFFD